MKTQPTIAQPDTDGPSRDEGEAETVKSHNRVKDLRNDAGMSRREVADELDISPAVLANIERGNTEPGVMLAWNVASYFDLPLEKVFSAEPLPTLTEILKRPCGCTTSEPEGSR